MLFRCLNDIQVRLQDRHPDEAIESGQHYSHDGLNRCVALDSNVRV